MYIILAHTGLYKRRTLTGVGGVQCYMITSTEVSSKVFHHKPTRIGVNLQISYSQYRMEELTGLKPEGGH